MTAGASSPSEAPPLSSLLHDAVGRARIHAGRNAEAVVAGDLMSDGAAAFAPAADTDTVAVLMTNDLTTVAVVLGAVAAGSRVVSLPLPARSADVGDYVESLRRACAAEGAREIVLHDDYAPLLDGSGLGIRKHSEVRGRPLAGPAAGGFELVQFSSGSTGRPKAIRLADAAIGANVSAIIHALEPAPGDMSVSWLPLSHDMGLIGMLLTSLASAGPGFAGGGDFVLLDPTDFLRSPQAWLDTMSAWGCTITAAPDFGYRMCTERSRAGELDLSRLRCAIVGGEVVRSTTLHGFAEHFAAAGFRAEAFCPSYGMAEIGLAAAVTPMGERWREQPFERVALADHRLVPTGPGGAGGAGGADAVVVVASGVPLAGYEVKVERTEADVLGELLVRAPSIGRDGATGASFAGSDGWYRTGDLGFVDDGWVSVTGRTDDFVVTAARNIYAPAVEEAIGAVDGVRAGRAAVVGTPTGEWVVVAEPDVGADLSEAGRRALVHSVQQAVVVAASARADDVVLVGRGTLPLTPSGKLQRRETLRRYVAGELDR